MKLRLVSLLAFTMLLFPLSASAQQRQETDAGAAALGFLLLGAATGSGVISGYSTWGREPVKHALNDRYLKEHYYALQQDLAVGAGDVVDDFASATGVRPDAYAQFGMLLRTHRKEVLAMADPQTVTPQRAQDLLMWLDNLAVSHGLKA